MESRLRSDESTLRDRVLAYLRHHNTLTLATWGPDGPWAAALFYVNDGFDLFWLSDPAARHSRNIAQSPRVAVAIHEDYSDWRAIQGLQMEGTATEVGPPGEAAHAMELYAAKYPFVGDWRRPPAEFARALALARVYRFTPERVLFIDNARGLGQRVEVPLGPG
jgi:uncharacterized protein YhbP (UPF0306 family)